jgi:hypothetical protein
MYDAVKQHPIKRLVANLNLPFIKKWTVHLLMFISFMILFLFLGWLFYIFYIRGPVQLETGDFASKATKEEVARPIKIQKYKLEHFHNLDDAVLGGIQYKSDCVLCHGNYAHTKSDKDKKSEKDEKSEKGVVHAYYNAHTWFIACEVCHVDPVEGQTFVYRWFDNETNEEITELEGPPGIFGARIAPAKYENGVLVRQGVYSGEDFIEQYLRKQLEQAEVSLEPPAMTEVHLALSEEVTADCDACHSEDGRLNFREILYSDKRAGDLESLDVSAMVKTYEEFHFPSSYDELEYRPTVEAIRSIKEEQAKQAAERELEYRSTEEALRSINEEQAEEAAE